METNMHIHLDLVGGISGDMFVGAMLDCFPELADSLVAQLSRAGFDELVKLDTAPYNDGVLAGTRFKVSPASHAEGHDHRHYSEIKQIIESSDLQPLIKHVAQEIFKLLADAEASVHGRPVDSIAFHEVGAWDSIADIISAATLIAAVPEADWSMSILPMGSGQVKTAHGMLPIPAPATTLLLQGFDCTDDGIEGERITPTGAAILRHLAPRQGSLGKRGKLTKTGYGFGTKKFPGLSNVLRLLVFDSPQHADWLEDQVLELAFEIDDQTPEDLAAGLDSIRNLDGVIDVLQYSALGKKGRQVMSIRVLGISQQETEILMACFEQTSTLGIRKRLVDRAILKRDQVKIQDDSHTFRVKVAQRPGGHTAKAEMDDVAGAGSNYTTRAEHRERIQRKATRQKGITGQDE